MILIARSHRRCFNPNGQGHDTWSHYFEDRQVAYATFVAVELEDGTFQVVKCRTEDVRQPVSWDKLQQLVNDALEFEKNR